jgi:DGQHR domain-containing protein
MFTLTAAEVLQVADISRVARDDVGELIGYQRPEVRGHIQEITEYLDSDQPLFPNPIIMALPSTVRFVCSRGSQGKKVIDGIAASGTLEIPLQNGDGHKPGWIVDGQQRAYALAAAKRQDFPVPVNAFVADSVDVQRDQFLRINNTKPLPRGLVTELLPKISTPLPPRLSVRKIPSALCDLLNSSDESPFRGMIRRPSASKDKVKSAVVTDTSLIEALKESLTSASGCLFPYRNLSSGETDFAYGPRSSCTGAPSKTPSRTPGASRPNKVG